MSPQLQASSLASLTNNNKKLDTKLVSKNEKSSQNCIGMHMNT
jgi:hypothetical protein